MLRTLTGKTVKAGSSIVFERWITYVALLRRTCSVLVCGRSLALGLLVRQTEVVAGATVRAGDWSEVRWFLVVEAVATGVSAAVVRRSPLWTKTMLELSNLDISCSTREQREDSSVNANGSAVG